MKKVNIFDNKHQWEFDGFCDTLFEAGYTQDELQNMEPREFIDAWLTWNGIIGYTDELIELVQSAYNLEFDL